MPKRPRTAKAGESDRLAAGLEAIDIRSPVEFSFAGEKPIDVRSLQGAPPWGGAPPAGEDLLARGIQATLYDRCYAERKGAEASGGSDPAFAARLRAANAGRERWDRGWIVQQFGPNGQAFVRKGDRERAAVPGAFIFDGPPGMAPQIGSQVSIRAPCEALDVQPGYYFAFGETLDELADQLSLSRLYFHCPAQNAAPLVGELTGALNRFQTPFQLKTPTAPALYGRTDAAVLYVAQRYFAIAARVVAQIRQKIRLEASTPLFTKTLWPGIGAAVEPGSGESFGSHRCRLAAEGIVNAWRQGEQGVAARLAAIGQRFGSEGLDFGRPWLGPNGHDPFELPQSARLT
jgi:HopA1 effector protein family